MYCADVQSDSLGLSARLFIQGKEFNLRSPLLAEACRRLPELPCDVDGMVGSLARFYEASLRPPPAPGTPGKALPSLRRK